MALFEGESTLWEDIQVKMGNFAPRDPKGPSNEELHAETMQRAEGVAKQDFVDSLFDQPEAEDVDLAVLRRNRLEQLMKQDRQATVKRITRESYTDEVTEGSKTATVVVMMDRGGGSSFLESECRKLAKEWNQETAPMKGWEGCATRFYVGDVDDLIGVNFPADQLPFAVVYSQGCCQSQLPRATIPGVRTALIAAAKLGERKSTDDTNRRRANSDDTSDIRKEIALRQQLRRNGDSEEDESDDEAAYQRSKGYASTYFAKNVLRQK